MSRQPSEDRGHLVTEGANPRAEALESMSALEAVDLFRREDAAVLTALEGAREDLALMIEIEFSKFLRVYCIVRRVRRRLTHRLRWFDRSTMPPSYQKQTKSVKHETGQAFAKPC